MKPKGKALVYEDDQPLAEKTKLKMQIKQKIRAGMDLGKIKFLGKKVPLVVTWAIASGCNYRCRYCEEWKRKGKELDTKEVFKIVNELARWGTKRISLSGGEPLLRADIGKIIDVAKQKGIATVITSNGSLVPAKIKELANLDLLKLSIDGPEEVQDKLRGKGAFRKVIEAVRAAREAGIRVVFNAVLTRYNWDKIDEILDLAESFKTGVRFSVLSEVHAERRRITPLFPRKEEYTKAIESLISAKKGGRPVLNSYAGLNYFLKWPSPSRISCFAGRGFAHIDAQGRLFPCVMMAGKKDGELLKDGFKTAFERLGKPVCEGCWCAGTLELNLLLAFNRLQVLENARKLI